MAEASTTMMKGSATALEMAAAMGSMSSASGRRSSATATVADPTSRVMTRTDRITRGPTWASAAVRGTNCAVTATGARNGELQTAPRPKTAADATIAHTAAVALRVLVRGIPTSTMTNATDITPMSATTIGLRSPAKYAIVSPTSAEARATRLAR